ncbi:hypothetical protein GA0115254_10953 [Streptomyces sp. Ncost-T10-10d]|nr:hypothetical protein GA0115254_10953 [Streptomyces sp. Ncost-T10-10d]
MGVAIQSVARDPVGAPGVSSSQSFMVAVCWSDAWSAQ